jgi:type I restriction enzyme S subunit
MSKQYSCDLCKKVFNQKIDFTRHQNKKAPCITLTEMQQISQIKEINMDIKSKLINVFKSCLNIMRDNEGLTGEKALRNLSYFLILKLIEPHLNTRINLDNYEYNFDDYEFSDVKELVEKHKNKLFEIAHFSILAKENENDIPSLMKYLWEDILSIHPTTKNIFLKAKGFDIQHKTTYKKLIDKLNSLDLSQTEYDVLGNAYEEVIQDIMTGKVLGQFFTQPLVKKMMVKLINPQIHPDGKIDTCGDPTMGTGGFLITYLQHILQQATAKNIKPDWDFIKTEGVYGKELEPDTYQLAVSNMLISSGHMFESLDRGDSIRVPITRKFDNILANPPFGIKGLKYDDFQSPLKSEYLPIKTDNAVSLFIQAIIYMLKINGKCAVVLPDGQDLFSKTNTTLVAIREYLMKTCDLKEIIYLPSGIFTYTTIKTCVFYFVKKREGTDVLETKIKVSKTQKETGRDYKFSKTHQTTKVKFYDYNPYEDVKNLLVEVPIEKIVSNSYSLNYAEYMKDETEEEQYEEGVIVKTLGEVCEMQNGKRIVKGQVETGEYPVLGGGGFTSFYTNEYSREGKTCKISREGMSLHNCVMLLNEKYYLNSQAFTIKSKNETIMINEYLWYYLDNNKEQVFKCGRGTAQKAIDIDEFKSIKIPIPSLEHQQEIVKYLDFIYEKANKTSNEKIAELKQLNEFYLSNQKIFGENVVKELGNVFKEVKTGKDVVATDRKKGEYPFYGANGIIDYVDSYIFDGKYLLTARTGSLGSLHISNGKFWCSGDVHRMEFENDTLLSYTYYYLQTIDFQKFRTGSAHPKLSGSSLKSIKIHIPSLERQKEIVEYCEYNDILIKQLEKEIENNKKQAQQFITNIVKSTSSIITK